MITRNTARLAFSLIEIIVIVAILVLLTMLSIPAVEHTLKASRVTVGGKSIVDELNLAQQTALSRNMAVEVRFYKLPVSTSSSAPGDFRAMQLFDDQGHQLSKMLYLPPGIVIKTDVAGVSTLLEAGGPMIDPAPKDGVLGVALPTYNQNYSFVSFRFRANGETDLNNNPPALLTVVSKNDPVRANLLPSNFVTLQLDPFSGRTRIFRP